MAYTTIDDPSAHFHTQLYTGDGQSTQAITNDGNSDLQPDLIWTKRRDSGNSVHVADTSRGITKQLATNNTNSEATDATIHASVQSDGFTVGDAGSVNTNTGTYCSWQWKCNGGTTTTNDASSTGVGNLDSVYQANTDAGFSIVTYSGAAGNNLVAHGLGVTPDLMIQKRRNNANTNDGRWVVWHKSLAALHNQYSFLFLHANNTRSEDTSVFGAGANTGPNSETFRIGNDSLINGSGGTHVMYCFAEKQGYSKFGSYTGNNANSGPFVYLGFKPAWLLIKCAVGHTESWHMWDNKRVLLGGNPNQAAIEADTTGTDKGSSTPYNVDFLSNGFKIREDHDVINGDGDTYVYMAFAEIPFVSSKGVPTTAI